MNQISIGLILTLVCILVFYVFRVLISGRACKDWTQAPDAVAIHRRHAKIVALLTFLVVGTIEITLRFFSVAVIVDFIFVVHLIFAAIYLGSIPVLFWKNGLRSKMHARIAYGAFCVGFIGVLLLGIYLLLR